MKKFAGLDISTNSLAFGVIAEGQLVDFGEVFFTGSNVFDRMLDAKHVTQKLVAGQLSDIDVLCFESAVIVRSAAVAMKMAYVFGVCVTEIMETGTKITECKPLEWQSGIGNPALKAAEKATIKLQHPGKSSSWYSSAFRQFRKQRTLNIINAKYGTNIKSDNIGDAVGVTLHLYSKLG
jgi:hypothetical protein